MLAHKLLGILFSYNPKKKNLFFSLYSNSVQLQIAHPISLYVRTNEMYFIDKFKEALTKMKPKFENSKAWALGRRKRAEKSTVLIIEWIIIDFTHTEGVKYFIWFSCFTIFNDVVSRSPGFLVDFHNLCWVSKTKLWLS